MEDDTTEIEMQGGDAVQEEHMMYGHGTMTEQELDEKFRTGRITTRRRCRFMSFT